MSPPKKGLRGYFRRANLLTSLALIFPLLIAYQLAVLVVPDAHNGADLFTSRLITLLGSKGNYLLFNLALVVLFPLALFLIRRRQEFDARLFVPVLLESGLYAISMGAVIVYTMNAIGISPALAIRVLHQAGDSAGALPSLVVDGAHLGWPTRLALSLGAGVHEELTFRLLIFGGMVLVGDKLLGIRHGIALAIAFVLSSLLFSVAHQLIGGDPWRVGLLTYRFFCGLIFAAIFQFRGLAVAVYTHALYDIYVMLFST